jgi:hypothetical protein
LFLLKRNKEINTDAKTDGGDGEDNEDSDLKSRNKENKAMRIGLI